MRNLANEEETVAALREALDDLGYSLRVVSSPKLDYRAYYPDVWPGYDPPEYAGTEGVLVNATHFAAFAREVFSSECD